VLGEIEAGGNERRSLVFIVSGAVDGEGMYHPVARPVLPPLVTNGVLMVVV